MNTRAFLVPLAIGTIILFIIAIVALFLVKKPLPNVVWALIPLYGIVTYFLYQMISHSSTKSPHRFVASVNASVLIKLFMTAIIVGVYFALGYPGRKALALSVMGIYAVYTTVLIWSLLPILRKDNKK
jgi:hypothetical protein